jgi:hypothetical protein
VRERERERERERVDIARGAHIGFGQELMLEMQRGLKLPPLCCRRDMCSLVYIPTYVQYNHT